MKPLLWSMLLMFSVLTATQDPVAPRSIVAFRCASAPTIDGRTDEPTWEHAGWSGAFVDITGKDELAPKYETRVALVWNDTALFIAAHLQEPNVWGTLRQRDTVIYYDNDFEFFFDPDGDNHNYGEIEVNALNTVWDLLLMKPYRDGGPAVTTWDIAGLQSAVHIDGTPNQPGDVDKGWSVELCIPWRSVQELSPSTLPPSPGRQWRVNFSRVQWSLADSGGSYKKAGGREKNWVWSPMGVVNMHLPERWGVVEFREAGETSEVAISAGTETARRALMQAHEALRAFRRRHGRDPQSMMELSGWSDQPIDARIIREDGARGPVMLLRTDERTLTVSADGRLGVRGE